MYKVVSEGIFNLADRFFEMDRTDALKVRGQERFPAGFEGKGEM